MTITRRFAAAALVLGVGLGLVAPAPAPARAAEVRLQEETDLKLDCQAHDSLASRQRGWARSRFEQCHHYFRHIDLKRYTGEHLGYIDFDLWVLAFAYDGTRRVDYTISLDNVHQTTSMQDDLTFVTLSLSGCAGRTDISCTTPQERTRTIAGWFAQPLMDVITVTSPDTAGTLPFYVTNFLAGISYFAEYRDGLTEPYGEAVGLNAVRFDSAGAPIGGKFKGAVFTDNVPALALPLTGAGIDAEARHVDDALHHPERTFPSFVGKNPPSHLHRLMDSSKIDSNHRASVRICENVWGPDYAGGGLDCDEYPFKSTKEGSSTSTVDDPVREWAWHGSARPIDSGQNQLAGSLLSAFYGANRVLDDDEFTVTTVP
jgi:hypothetical protein